MMQKETTEKQQLNEVRQVSHPLIPFKIDWRETLSL